MALILYLPATPILALNVFICKTWKDTKGTCTRCVLHDTVHYKGRYWSDSPMKIWCEFAKLLNNLGFWNIWFFHCVLCSWFICVFICQREWFYILVCFWSFKCAFYLYHNIIHVTDIQNIKKIHLLNHVCDFRASPLRC